MSSFLHLWAEQTSLHGGGDAVTTTKAILMGEYGTDPDEKLALIMAAWLVRKKYLDLLAVIGNHVHALQRAQDAKFILNEMSLAHVPVGMGEQGFGASSEEYENNPLFLAPATQLHHGRPTLRWTLEHSDDDSVVLVLNSGFTDAVWLWMDAPDLFLKKVQRVVIMGGVEMDGNVPYLNQEGFMVPSLGKGGAANNCFDPGASLHLYDLLQRHNKPMVVTTRFLAYGCMMPFSLYGDLAKTHNVVGVRLDEHQRASIDGLWKKVNAKAGTKERGDLPLRCNRKWFVDRFCGGRDPGIKATGDIVPYIIEFALYDVMNLISAIPQLLHYFYDPYVVEVRGTQHMVNGLSEEYHCVRNPDMLRQFTTDGMVQALQYGRTPMYL